MTVARIGLLIVGHVDPKCTHLAGDYPELFDGLLGHLGIELMRYELDVGRFPQSVAECDGWICSPSRSSVNDELAWITDAEALLREIVAAERPYVGICFGHQLLARALGARVERFAHGWQVGVHGYEIVQRRAWMAPPLDRIALIASHQDQVAVLPPGAELLARSPTCAVAGFTVGERAWTLQAHPEFVAPLAERLLAGRVELIGGERVAAARASLTRSLDREAVGGWIARFFATSSA